MVHIIFLSDRTAPDRLADPLCAAKGPVLISGIACIKLPCNRQFLTVFPNRVWVLKRCTGSWSTEHPWHPVPATHTEDAQKQLKGGGRWSRKKGNEGRRERGSEEVGSIDPSAQMMSLSTPRRLRVGSRGTPPPHRSTPTVRVRCSYWPGSGKESQWDHSGTRGGLLEEMDF